MLNPVMTLSLPHDRLHPNEQSYLHYHRNRFHFAFNLLNDLALSFRSSSPEQGVINLTDFGPGFLTHWMRTSLPQMRVNQLGYANHRIAPVPASRHIEYNLCHLPMKHTWPNLSGQHIINAGEIVEHLPVSMDIFFEFVNSALVPGGYLVVQTPNAASLKKRTCLLFGKNPYDLIRDTMEEHGHIREFTVDELIKFGTNNGFEVVKVAMMNYFSYDHSLLAKTYKRLADMLPQRFRDGITIVYKKKTVLPKRDRRLARRPSAKWLLQTPAHRKGSRSFSIYPRK